jgi:hypothetical protein
MITLALVSRDIDQAPSNISETYDNLRRIIADLYVYGISGKLSKAIASIAS